MARRGRDRSAPGLRVFVGCPQRQRERVEAPRELLAEECVNTPVSLDSTQGIERCRDDRHVVVRLHTALVAMALVLDPKGHRREGREAPLDAFLARHRRGLFNGAPWLSNEEGLTTLPAMSGRTAFALLLVASAAACSEEETAARPTGPTGTVSFSLVSPGDGACVAIGDDVQARVPLLVAVENFLLRPPGACGSAIQCGHLRVRADGLDNSFGASPAVELDLGKLAQPYHDGALHAGTNEPNLLPVEVTLLGDDGEPWLDDEGTPLQAAIKLAIKPTCD